MSLTLDQIIEEADNMVPNGFSESQKVGWLNEINHEFFDVVKIPKVFLFNSISYVQDYLLSDDIQLKNIDRVIVGNMAYLNMMFNNINPVHNYWTFDDDTHVMNLSPAPASSGLKGMVRYFKTPKKTFVTENMSDTPDAPEDYHRIYILGLCEKIAKAMNDPAVANNYANDYQGMLSVAQQNYKK